MWIVSGAAELKFRDTDLRTTPIRFIYIITSYGDVVKRVFRGRWSEAWQHELVDEYVDTIDDKTISRVDDLLVSQGIDLQPYVFPEEG